MYVCKLMHAHILSSGRKVAAVERRQRRAALLVHSLPSSGDAHAPTQVRVPTFTVARRRKWLVLRTRCCDAKCVLYVLTRCAHKYRDLKWASYTIPLCWELRGIWSQHNKVADVAMSDVSLLVELLPPNWLSCNSLLSRPTVGTLLRYFLANSCSSCNSCN